MTVEEFRNLCLDNPKSYCIVKDYDTDEYLDWCRLEFIDCIKGYENAIVVAIDSESYFSEEDDNNPIVEKIVNDICIDLLDKRQYYLMTISIRRV